MTDPLERMGCALGAVLRRPAISGQASITAILVPTGDGTTAGAGVYGLEGAPTRPTGEDGKRAVEIVQTAYRSNQTGRTVDLPLTE